MGAGTAQVALAPPATPDAHGAHTFRPPKLVMRARSPSPAPRNAGQRPQSVPGARSLGGNCRQNVQLRRPARRPGGGGKSEQSRKDKENDQARVRDNSVG